MPFLSVLIVIALVYHFAGVFGLVLLALAGVLLLARSAAARTRRHNPAPQPPNTYGRRR